MTVFGNLVNRQVSKDLASFSPTIVGFPHFERILRAASTIGRPVPIPLARSISHRLAAREPDVRNQEMG
jgi:hypothetical protein